METEQNNYCERVVAFIDILGFKNHIDESINKDNTTNTSKFEIIQSALDIINETAKKELPINKYRKVTLFSDSIIISFGIKEKSELFYTLLELLHMNMELLQLGILIRGGITSGKCFHSKSRVFGSAVIRAYELEQKANFPRILLDKDVIPIVIKNHASHHDNEEELKSLSNLLKYDVDGQWYLDYFSAALMEVDDTCSQFGYIHHMEKVIRLNLKKFEYNEHVLHKYNWMASKYNEMLFPMVDRDNIERFERNDPEIKEWLEQLSLII